jgi:cobalt/nickel transport protein
VNRRRFFLAFVVFALLLAGVVSGFASEAPDGLERVAHDEGFADRAQEHVAADGPLADYGVPGLEGLASGGVAGVVGVLVVLVVTAGIVLLVRRREPHRGS